MRYAKATKVSISLMKQDNTLILNIKDDGCGFDVSKVDTKLHHGLLGIRERVYAINGKFNISSVLGDGTLLNLEVPL
jgi:signal transduction histidine kinase